MNIYDLTTQWLQIQEMIENEDADPKALSDTLECIDFEIEEKAENYARIIKNIEAETAGIKAEEERLSKKRKAAENKIKIMKENLFAAMKITGKEKFKTEKFSFAIQKNPASVHLIDGFKVPEKYLVNEPKVNLSMIKEDLKAGQALDFAELVQKEGLRIK